MLEPSYYLDDLDNLRLIKASWPSSAGFDGSNIYVDVGETPQALIEVRRTDTGWGTNNRDLIGRFSTRTFTLPRLTFEQVWYFRYYDGSSISRRSKVVRIYAPLVPQSPILDPTQPINPDNITDPLHIQYWFAFNGDIRNIYGIEIRASNNITVIERHAVTSPYDLIWTYDNSVSLLRTATIYVYFISSMGDYSAVPLAVTVTTPAPPRPVITIGQKLTTHVELLVQQLFNRNDIKYLQYTYGTDPTFATFEAQGSFPGQPAVVNFVVQFPDKTYYFVCDWLDDFGQGPGQVIVIPQENFIDSGFIRGQGSIIPSLDNQTSSLFTYTSSCNSGGGPNSARIVASWPTFEIRYADASLQSIALGSEDSGFTLSSSLSGPTDYNLFPEVKPINGSILYFDNPPGVMGGWCIPDGSPNLVLAAQDSQTDGTVNLGGSALSFKATVPTSPASGGGGLGRRRRRGRCLCDVWRNSARFGRR